MIHIAQRGNSSAFLVDQAIPEISGFLRIPIFFKEMSTGWNECQVERTTKLIPRGRGKGHDSMARDWNTNQGWKSDLGGNLLWITD